MSRIEQFFNSLKATDSELVFDKICLEEKQYVRNYYSTAQSAKWGFSKYRKYLKNEYFKDDPILSIAISDIDNLKDKIDSDDSVNDSIITIATKYNLSIVYLKKQYLDYLKVLNCLKIRTVESNQIKESYNEKVKLRRSDLQYILDVDGYINQAVELLEAKSFIYKILGLAALTGRRVAEIGCTANFKPVSNYKMLFSGQLKTKKTDNDLIIEIPVLCDAKLIILAMDDLRSLYPQYIDNPTKFHNNCSSYLSEKIDVFNSYIEGDLTPKDLRAIYACIAYKRHCHNDRMDDTAYYSYILGHDEKDNATFLSYTKYKII
jgi:hypothetical protein